MSQTRPDPGLPSEGLSCPPTVEVALEIGKRRVFASAVAWPGWCRQGRTEAEALEALWSMAPAYEALVGRGLGFVAPQDLTHLRVVERIVGNATTDFGAPGQPLASDQARRCTQEEQRRLEAILAAAWDAFDAAVAGARGVDLRQGPRGGGRSLEAIEAHVLEAEASYVSALGGKVPREDFPPYAARRRAVLETLRASGAGEIPEQGPRGAGRWTARTFVRRAAWHLLAHAWEIERRRVR